MKKTIVLVVALLVLGACGGDEVDLANPAYGDVAVSGQALPQFSDPTADPAIGMPAPSVSGVDFNGQAVEFTPGQGPAVLVFLAHWCPHCQSELPVLAAWQEANPDMLGLEMYAVATGTANTEPNYPPGPWIEREGWAGSVIMDDQNYTAAKQFGLTKYPYFVVVDSDGLVQLRTSGGLPAPQVDALLQAASEL
jgi:cytochrome c biogenesis protein CcmG/thiol:disulfide interchange protein DsbE